MEAINSDSIVRKRLALNAFRSALQREPLTRMVGANYQGARAPPKLWAPTTPKEVLDNYRRVWSYLGENLEKFDGELRDEAVDVLRGSARAVASIHLSLSEIVRNTIIKND